MPLPENAMELEFVWVFNGRGQFPSGVFSARATAEAWIAAYRLTGCLTKYPLDMGAYEWAVSDGYFKPKRDDQNTPRFIGAFACGREHYHYEDGQCHV
jgi:hypothetical protein